MFGLVPPASLPLRRAVDTAARALLALLCPLALLGAPSPVLCLEAEDACGAQQGAEHRPATCHDTPSASIPYCESCTDVVAPEEPLPSSRPDSGLETAVAIFRPHGFAEAPPAHGRSPRGLGGAQQVSTPALLRTTVLLI